jgi:hypothetical protein
MSGMDTIICESTVGRYLLTYLRGSYAVHCRTIGCVLHRAVYTERMVSLEQPSNVEGIAEMAQGP